MGHTVVRCKMEEAPVDTFGAENKNTQSGNGESGFDTAGDGEWGSFKPTSDDDWTKNIRQDAQPSDEGWKIPAEILTKNVEW